MAELQHEGGDTFMGHQEILGTRPLPPLRMPFRDVIDRVEQALVSAGWQVERRGDDLQFLWVNQAVAIGDNLEADLGQVYNITANLSVISFDDAIKMGRIVREQVQVGRVITFGGLLTDSQCILDAAESKEGRFIGINAPRSGAYDNGFRSYIWATVSMKSAGTAKLYEAGVPTVLVGKVADIVSNPYGVSWQNRWIASGLWISPSTNLTPIRRRLFVPISVKPTSLVMQKTSHVMPNVCRSLTVTLPGLLRRCSQMIARS